MGRLAFNYPYDYVPQSTNTYFYFIPNAIVLFTLGSALWVWRTKRLSIAPEVIAVAIAALLVLGATSLLHANARMARPLLFMLALLIAVSLGAPRDEKSFK